MNSQTAMAHLAAYREGKVSDPRISKALRCIENESMMRERLAEQVAFDVSVMEMLSAIGSPEDLRHRLAAAKPAAVKGAAARPQHHLTAVLAVGLGVAIIICVLVFFQWQARKNFPGREALVKIASAANGMSGAELEPVVNSAGDLGDWFYMRGFEHFRVPAELRKAPAVGSRVFKMDGHPIAQIAIDPHQSLVYIFDGEDFGVTLPGGDEWTIFSADDWAAAVRQYGPSMAMIAFRGTEAEMRDFLSNLKP